MGNPDIARHLDGAVTDLAVSEMFGPTIQGEGPHAGRRRLFLRLARCNLDCAWCDTPYTWDWTGKNGVAYNPKTEVLRYTVDAVAQWVARHGHPIVVATGGEPLLQHTALSDLADRLGVLDVETNGTLPPLDAPTAAVFYVVSPKLPSSGVPVERAVRPERLADFRRLAVDGHAAFKFVVADAGDLSAVDRLVAEHDLPTATVWLMPEGRTAATLDANLAAIADRALDCGYNVSDRLHVRIWGTARGH